MLLMRTATNRLLVGLLDSLTVVGLVVVVLSVPATAQQYPPGGGGPGGPGGAGQPGPDAGDAPTDSGPDEGRPGDTGGDAGGDTPGGPGSATPDDPTADGGVEPETGGGLPERQESVIGRLPRTGAGIAALCGVGLAFLAVGATLIRRARKQQLA